MTTDLDVFILGPTEVRFNNGSLPLRAGKPRQILTTLALDVGQTISVDRLIDVVWGDSPPATATKALRVHVSELRKRLGHRADALETDGSGYRLSLPPDRVDSNRFETLIGQGHSLLGRMRMAEALNCYEGALALWRGPALADLGDNASSVAAAQRLGELCLRAREESLAARLELGEVDAVVAGVGDLVVENPLREGLYALQMLALYRAGRQGDALAAFQQARTRLIEELGVEPGPKLRAVERAVLQQDPGLAGHTGTTGRTAGAPTLLGRSAELAAAADALNSTRSGAGRLVILTGEAGIGKTALAREISRSAQTTGAATAMARCRMEASGVAFWPLRRALERLDGATGHTTQSTKRMVALLQTSADPDPADTATGTWLRRQDELTEALAQVAEHRWLVVVIDDLQWADDASLDLLGHLAGELATMPALIIATMQTTEPRESPALDRLLVRLRRERTAQLLELHPFDPDDVAAFVADALGSRAEPELPTWFTQKSGGNPLLLTELVSWIRHQPLADLDPSALPVSIQEVIGHRLEGLDATTRTVLDLAAVLGEQSDVAVLVDVGVEREVAETALEELEARRLLRRGRGARSFTFAHGVVRDLVYELLGDAERARLHDRLATALDGRTDGGVVAHHAIASLPVGSAGRAVRAALAEGRRAVGQLAFGDAVRWFDEAVTASMLLDDDPRLRLEALLGYGDAATRAGHTNAARPRLQEAVEIARRLGDGPALARVAVLRAVDRSPEGSGDRAELADLFAEANDALGDSRTELKVRLIDLLVLSRYFTDPPGERLALAETALDIARDLDPGTMALALNGRAMALAGPDDPEERLKITGEAIATARRGGAREPMVIGHMTRVCALYELGQMAAADAEVEHAAGVAERTREPRFLWQVSSWRALRLLRCGEFDAAERTMAESLLLWHDGAPIDAMVCQAVHTVTLRLLQGRSDEVIATAAMFAAQMPELPTWQAVHALCCAAAGRTDEAKTSMEACLVDGVDAFRTDATLLSTLTALAETSWVLDESRWADQIRRRLEPYVDHHVVIPVFGGGGNYWGNVGHSVGLLDGLLGDLSSATRRLEAARTEHLRVGASPFAERSERALARCSD